MNEQARRPKNAGSGVGARRSPFALRLLPFVHRSWPLALLLLLALALRLLVWHWRGDYPLGGDESEYLEQARTLLIQHRYVELQLMRPPLYTLFLAGSIVLFDSLAQNLRLMQVCLSAATLVPMWLLMEEILECGMWIFEPNLFQKSKSNIQNLACLLMALSYTLAANATELLSETLFLFGLTTLFWLLVRVSRLIKQGGVQTATRWAALAGLTLGLLCLTRSVALPLLPLGAVWLALQKTEHSRLSKWRSGLLCAMCFALCAFCVIAPWTARNYATYGALIVIDTTGAENLWLDNNPDARTAGDLLGREDAKRQLYALKDDRAARQRLASQRGIAAIRSQPAWFLTKAYGESLKFFALEYSDDMRARPAIWVPPAEVWTRLVLGDGLWLTVLLVGVYGLMRFWMLDVGLLSQIPSKIQHPTWLFIPWALYILFTALLFHVELRYRLPLYPVLIPYAALVLVGSKQQAATRRWSPFEAIRLLCCLLPAACCLLLMLLHAPYPALAWTVGWKHYDLAQSARALAAGDSAEAQAHAQAALALDGESALAHVALARAALLRGDQAAALRALDAAIASQKDQSYAHLLRGDILRSRGDEQQALNELSFEHNKGLLEDIQGWAAARFISSPPVRLAVGDGLDLGFVRGFFLAEKGGWRWTAARASLRFTAPASGASLHLRLASGRPSHAPAPALTAWLGDQQLGTIQVDRDWHTYTLPLPASARAAAHLEIDLRVDTFTPRSYDRASPDGRTLGVMVDWAEVGP